MILLYNPFSGMDSFSLLIFLLMLVTWCVALVAIANGRFYDTTTKLCWFFIVLGLNVVGVLLFIFWGRKEVQYRPATKKNEN